MKQNVFAFMLAVTGGILCIGNFIYRLTRFDEKDYLPLAIGVLILALGISSWMRNRKR